MKELQRRIDSDEFAEWMAEYRVEPWGEDWRQTATLQATLVNLNSKRSVSVEDCMPGRMSHRQQTAAEMRHRLDLFFKSVMKRQEKKAKRGDERQQPPGPDHQQHGRA